jgi:hypothetical protein
MPSHPEPAVPAPGGSTAYVQVRDLLDSELDAAYDRALADYALATKYEHNAHLLPAITQRLDACKAEYAKRGKTPPHEAPGGSGPNQGGTVKLEQEVADLLNRHSMENGSNTPDYVLAEFLMRCLAAFDLATVKRDTHYGRAPRPGEPDAHFTGGSGGR